MLHAPKKIASLILYIGLTFLSTSCGMEYEYDDSLESAYETTTTTTVETTTVETTVETSSTEESTTVTTEYTGFDYTTLLDLYDPNSISDEMKSIDWSIANIFTDTQSAMEYLVECTRNYQTTIGIVIPQGTEQPISDYYKSYGLNVTGISYNQATLSDQTNTADFIVYTPKYSNGNLISHAYLTGDTSTLTDEQLQAYYVAKDYIENTLDTAKSSIEQERQIFDYVCNSTQYYNDESVDDSDYARYKSCVGLLLDGRSNCMGYSDTFYMLCTMAGFEVKYISESQMVHAWNLITLDGKEYLVDTTYADTSLEEDVNYLYFNASLDFVSKEYTLSQENPTNDINPTCDENFYFFAEEFGSLNANATDVYDTIIDLALQDSSQNIQLVCTEELPSDDQFIDSLRERLPSELGGSISYLILRYYNLNYIVVSFG